MAQLRSTCRQLTVLGDVIHALRHGSDMDAAELLARLRIGEDVSELASAVKQRLSV